MNNSDVIGLFWHILLVAAACVIMLINYMNHSYEAALKAVQFEMMREYSQSKLGGTLIPPVFHNGDYSSFNSMPHTQSFEEAVIEKSKQSV